MWHLVSINSIWEVTTKKVLYLCKFTSVNKNRENRLYLGCVIV